MSVQFATKVIVPVDCALFALDGIKALLARVNQIQETTNLTTAKLKVYKLSVKLSTL